MFALKLHNCCLNPLLLHYFSMALKTLLLKRNIFRGKIARIIQKNVSFFSLVGAKYYLELLEKYQIEYEANFDEIFLIEDEANQAQRLEEFTVDMDRVDSYKYQLLDFINSFNASTCYAPTPSIVVSQIPVTLSIPKFDEDAISNLFLSTMKDSGYTQNCQAKLETIPEIVILNTSPTTKSMPMEVTDVEKIKDLPVMQPIKENLLSQENSESAVLSLFEEHDIVQPRPIQNKSLTSITKSKFSAWTFEQFIVHSEPLSSFITNFPLVFHWKDKWFFQLNKSTLVTHIEYKFNFECHKLTVTLFAKMFQFKKCILRLDWDRPPPTTSSPDRFFWFECLPIKIFFSIKVLPCISHVNDLV